ncbi:hypothetical protein DPSP01_006942 [Paraphaeosphaeria sporulosa]|uniref:C2H2-type domain-containing protein n=1 Tax=Paraphaeosphaeria sporulosa TaxID=1460663 RepID=A0A177CGX8_9PLEO|nr:uncharacterized protein CC84DRAFT_1195102 [Paraphaeosphaeria sporulosa]OAG06596.1 hypothetical protein CC84DRAFT_1195102 [Paraphaeosphaeria sporulosa]
MSANYDSDDALPNSPGLAPFRPRVTPSPSPPPIVSCYPTHQNVSHSSSRRRKKSNRRKTIPSQGDSVLISIMDPNQPDIARQAGERALNSDSGSENEDEEMETRSPTEVASVERANQSKTDGASLDLSRVAQRALNVDSDHTFAKPYAPIHRDSVVEPEHYDPLRKTSIASHATDTSGNGSLLSVSDAFARTRTYSVVSVNSSSSRGDERNGSIANGRTDSGSSGKTADLHELAIPSRSGSPSQKLPALQTPQSPPQEGVAHSPNTQKQSLPGFRHLSDLAETAIQEQETRDRNNSIAHRQSISSTGASPTSVGRQLSITSLSPNSNYGPHSATSPAGDPQSHSHPSFQTRDPFLRSGQHLTLFASSTRRPSQASDSGPYSASTLHSATTNDSYQSSEGVSPGAQATPIEIRGGRNLSIDGALANRTLPPPPGVGAGMPGGGIGIAHAGSVNGGFKCDYPGCAAAPFQTQYLLNSHANVHSQSRPHYCPVPGCPRAEGGKGFKRKNEMIRHGLVHASPGYVCPFCPDREHKYPRPDNLQRHVRVHHVDKDKDDPQLREVLAQRPEGGSRGRRRRVSDV